MINFDTFYITWYARGIFFARTYVLSEVEAENIVQDVFLHLYERRELLDDQINLIAYFFTSIKNKCMDFLRKQMQEYDAINGLQEELALVLRMKYDSLEIFNTDFPDNEVIEQRLHTALQNLPENCRNIFIKNKLEGKKQKQIADELGISINTVESQMAIAYKKLREELKDCLPLLAFLFSI